MLHVAFAWSYGFFEIRIQCKKENTIIVEKRKKKGKQDPALCVVNSFTFNNRIAQYLL